MPADTTTIARLLGHHRIAIVGISDDAFKPSHRIARYLIDAGYDVVPVNPNLSMVLGRPCYPDLSSIASEVGLVNVFRQAKFCPDVTRAAVSAGAVGVWLQSGIVSPESRTIAAAAGIDFVQDRCIMIEHSIVYG